MKDEIIYSYKLANYLLNKGYMITSIKPNKKEVGKLIFHFVKDDNIMQTIEQFKKEYSNKHNMSKGDNKHESRFCESTKQLVSRE